MRSNTLPLLVFVTVTLLTILCLSAQYMDHGMLVLLDSSDASDFEPLLESPVFAHQAALQILSECKLDNPISRIAEPNVFPGAVGYGPDWPQMTGAPPDCDSQKMNVVRKTYEITEPNFKKWKEFSPDYNVFPFSNGKSGPDSPGRYPDAEDVKLFDGHGGIIGLEDSMKWTGTPGSAAPKVQGKYADGSTTGMDSNVFANGYKFPDY
mmetsp:Transcript_21716/g.59511  ORF Transcript_21716/g.59511 Transcript_21716/m.59511 type:complete len:208 (+) Transcript_21716:146-769(+)